MTAAATRTIAIVLGLMMPTTVFADASTAAAEAEFQKAVKLRSERKWREACDAFQKSQTLDPQHGTAFNLAGCYREIGKLVQAWTLYRELSQRDSNAGRKAKAAKLASELEPRLSYLRVDATTRHPDLAVTIDGEPATALVGVETPIDVGAHSVTASAPGHETWTQTVTIKREADRVSISIPTLEATAQVTTADTSVGEKESVEIETGGRTIAETRRWFATVALSLGAYSAPPGVSVTPAFAVGAKTIVGIDITRASAARIGVGAILNGDVVIDQTTFQRLFAGLGARVAMRKLAIHAGPGVTVLTGAGETVTGFGAELGATFLVSGRLGVGLDANLSSVAQPFGLMGNLMVLRAGVGVAYSY